MSLPGEPRLGELWTNRTGRIALVVNPATEHKVYTGDGEDRRLYYSYIEAELLDLETSQLIQADIATMIGGWWWRFEPA